jgi:molybdenum cofactor synthesis domain-containing protein
MKTIKILSVNTSVKKGTVKMPVDQIILDKSGIVGDAHAGLWHRQVSLLGIESIRKMEQAKTGKFHFGNFAENVTTEGYPLYTLKPLDRLINEDIRLEVTQIGKKCHGEKCTVFRETGDCVMPKEGIFCRVIQGGVLKQGDLLMVQPKVMGVKVITLSDRASRGEYEDKSGPLLKQLVQEFFTESGRPVEIELRVIPDEPEHLQKLIYSFTQSGADMIFTTGGTGIGPHDITPDTLRPMLDKEIPGIMEMIRVKYGSDFPGALISRSIAGVISETLIYALPGSPNAVREYAAEIFKTVEHSLNMLHEIDQHR